MKAFCSNRELEKGGSEERKRRASLREGFSTATMESLKEEGMRKERRVSLREGFLQQWRA